MVRTEGEFPSQEIIAEGEDMLVGNTPHPLSPGSGQLPALGPTRPSAARRGEKSQESAIAARHTEQPLPG